MLVAGPIETYKDYSQFSSLKDFNTHIEMFLAVHKDKFTKGEFMLFRRFTKYCAKVPGVANASIKEFLRGTKEKDFKYGASESTFHRMKRKAIELGILEVKPINRRNGSQSSNLWIFKKFLNNDTPQTQGEQVEALVQQGEDFRRLTPLKTSIISKTSNLNNINKRNRYVGQATPNVNQSLDHTFTPSYIPKDFVNTVKPFFDNAETIVKLWSSSSNAIRKIARLNFPESAIDTVIEAFKETIYKYKARKIKNDFNGYYYGVLTYKLIDKVKEVNTQYPDPNYKRKVLL